MEIVSVRIIPAYVRSFPTSSVFTRIWVPSFFAKLPGFRTINRLFSCCRVQRWHYAGIKPGTWMYNSCQIMTMAFLNSWPSRSWKKILLAFLSTFWHPCSKCILMCFKKDRGGCQVWKCPKVPELGQRSTECKFLYIRQILAFLSISYPKLWFKVMQNLFWILQPYYINKQHHQGIMCVWIKGHLSAKSLKIVEIFFFI